MYKWRAESILIRRYLGVGVINTLVGFLVIFALTWYGVSPWLANSAGYAVGLLLGFVMSRALVFSPGGSMASEGGRYLVAFALAFLVNLVVLRIALGVLGMSRYSSQIAASISYTVAMYLLSRHVVFTTSRRAQP